jgi:deoxyribodipyrimidine photo-lyase
VNIVWFKRDLRVWDHAALAKAAAAGPVLPLYILEPELWAQPDMSGRQYAFLGECLQALDQSLSRLGQPLILRVGDAVDVLAELASTYDIKAIYAHQETWNSWSYDRDRAVGAWAKKANIAWHELQQFGVHRAMDTRNGWARKWDMMMQQPVMPPPSTLPALSSFCTDKPIISADMPGPTSFGIDDDDCPGRQQGGRPQAIETLKSFLQSRGRNYRFEMSSPVTAAHSCSRLSPYLAFGCVSMREVYQASQRRLLSLKNDSGSENRGSGNKNWRKSLQSFEARLHWHCHFIQKLEDEPQAEFRAFHPAYRGFEKETIDAPQRLAAWQEGRTGYPLVDACMRQLAATGWLTFRMRAMVMSFASYHLWLDWRAPALHLARQFVDYEPGIHYSQCQMQSGITGINTIRIYNPVKQSQDQDKAGLFIRKWLPELHDVPDSLIHTPWLKPDVANEYPAPIVDEKQARKAAAAQIYSIRKDPAHRRAAKKVVAKHASGRSGNMAGNRRPLSAAVKNQLELGL